jgi:hypothetical protein
MFAFAAVLWTASFLSQSPPAQPSVATGLIVGRVVDGSTGRPIAGAIVTLDGGTVTTAQNGPRAPRAITNATGQFVFRKLRKGTYHLSATRGGYAGGSYGQRRPGGVSGSLQLDEGQRVGDVDIPMWKHATIAGSVVDEAGEPMINVQVRTFRREFVAGRLRVTPSATTSTDDRGLYRFSSLVPGDYLVAFVWREASVPTSVAELLANPAAMNDPKNADVMRERFSLGTSGFNLGSANTMQIGTVVRDLAYNAPVPPSGDADAPLYIYPTQFYPGAATALRARSITVASGESREGVDFALRPVKSARVSGTVLGPDGPLPNVAVRLVPAEEDALTTLETSVTMTGSGGEFTLLGVPPGQYVLRVVRTPRPNGAPNATPVTTQIQIGSSMMITSSGGAGGGTPAPVPDDPTLAAEVPLAVAGTDLTDVLVALQRGARVSGHYEFDGNAPRPSASALTRILVSLSRADGAQGSPFTAVPYGHADETGAFKTYGVAPGRYLLRVTSPEGWTFRSASLDGRDLADTPFDLRNSDIDNVVITFTDRPTQLSGTVRSANGNVDPAALVVVFPADASGWADYGAGSRRLRSARVDRRGFYSLSGLPPGDYYVGAIHEESTPQWQDPQVLEELARSASQVRLGDGEGRTQDVKSSGGGL